ncbi:MAG: hypothetical protein EOL98_13960 [Negativicutes bacterium]|nr:hypothetical protein [Negativicutes bacterium]
MSKIKEMESITIQVYRSVNYPGYYYSIYDTSKYDLENEEEIDGGLCTSDLTNALEMATDQALAIVKSNRDACHKQDLETYNALSLKDKEEVDQRISNMKEHDADDDEEWDGTDAQYLTWALEELFANKPDEELKQDIVNETVAHVSETLKPDDNFQQEEYKDL